MEYLRYWSLREPPFGPAASRFFFLGSPQRETLSWIQDLAVGDGKTGLIAARSGCGLTSLFQRVSQSCGFDDCATEVVLTNGRHPSVERVHNDLAGAMGVIAKRNSLSAVSTALDDLNRKSIHAVWLIDGLGKHSADAVLQVNRKCPSLTVIGSVTPRLQRLVSRSLGKRIAQTSLPAFEIPETRAFIAHSMQTAGCRTEPFSDEALNEIHRLSEGRIGMISRIGRVALMFTARHGIKQATVRDIQVAADNAQYAA
ncbi:MAG: hypothetical protein WBD20_12210 [Pirellulaceae bacterium]